MALDNYFLLKIIDRAGGIKGRKRFQKLVYLAKLEGCPTEDQFFFHYYGPYSSDFAARVDDLVERGLLSETSRGVGIADAVEFAYRVTDEARARMARVDEKVPSALREQAERFAQRVASLADREVFELELAATMLYWREAGQTWDKAEAITVQRKGAVKESETFQRAAQLAKEVWQNHPA